MAIELAGQDQTAARMASLGFDFTQDDFDRLEALDQTDVVRYESPIGGYRQWCAGQGIELWLHANAVDKLVGCQPHFAGGGRLDAAIIETMSSAAKPMDGYCFGWAAPSDPGNPYSGMHAYSAWLPDFAVVDEKILIPPTVTLQTTAFAKSLGCYPTEMTFLQSEWGVYYGAERGRSTWIQLEDEGTPVPDVVLSGYVMESFRIDNPASTGSFHHLLVQTSSGTIDIVADMDVSARRPVTGSVIAGVFTLSARVVSPLPTSRKAVVRAR